MTTKEAVDVAVELLRVLTAWPLILLACLLIFRKELRRILPELASRLGRRITKASIGGTSFEFSKEEQEALRETIEKGATDLSGRPEELADFVTQQVSKVVVPHHGTGRERRLDGKTILWVDDNPENNTYEVNLFRRLGANVQLSTSTAGAIEAFKSRRFDLVITDISRVEEGKRNRKAGYELISWLELREGGPYVPSVIYTGNVNRVDRVASAPAAGAADDPGTLREIVLDAIGRR